MLNKIFSVRSLYVFQSFKFHNMSNAHMAIPDFMNYDLFVQSSLLIIFSYQPTKRREAKLRLVIKTDINDISSVGQNPKRVTPAQDTKLKCVGYG